MAARAHIFQKVKNYDCRHQLEKLKAEKISNGGNGVGFRPTVNSVSCDLQ